MSDKRTPSDHDKQTSSPQLFYHQLSLHEAETQVGSPLISIHPFNGDFSTASKSWKYICQNQDVLLGACSFNIFTTFFNEFLVHGCVMSGRALCSQRQTRCTILVLLSSGPFGASLTLPHSECLLKTTRTRR